MKIFIVALVLVFLSTCNAINWQEGNWAWNCDFPSINLGMEPNFPSINLYSVLSFPESCYQQCQQLSACTHFVWTDTDDGTCFFKTGAVTQSNALDAWFLPEFEWFSTICGIPPK
jgi:hypothetical protein